MKKIIKIYTLLIVSLFIVSCDPQEDTKPKLGDAPSSEIVTFTATPLADNANRIRVESTTPGAFMFKWEASNNKTSNKKIDTISFPIKGEYTIKLTAFTKAGHGSSVQTVVISTDDACGDPLVNALTGACEGIDGKIWVFDPVNAMNFGGPGDTDIWWKQTLKQQNPCMQDDEYVFHFKDNKFVSDHKGEMWGAEGGSENVCVDQGTLEPSTSTWAIVGEGGKNLLKISGGLTVAWDDNEGTYEIVELTATRLQIRKTCCGGGPDNPHRNYVLVPKGTGGGGGPDPEPEPGKPLESKDIFDTFDANGNVVYNSTEMTQFNDAFDNPKTDAINGSGKVALYEKGTGQANAFNNLKIDLPHRIDLTTRNKFRMKVYLPSSNDYTQELGKESWQNAYSTLQKQVSLKLQDSTNPSPWETQAEKIVQVSTLDEWVVVEFDFSDVSSRTDLDRVLIQFGGEAHYNPGTFYFDDLELLP